MARISEYVEIDIEVSDFLNECDSGEITDVIEWLTDNEQLDNDEIHDECVTIPETHSIQDEIWNESVLKLLTNRHGLSVEDENLIIELSKKFL